MSGRRDQLLKAAQSFTDAFATHADPETIYAHFSTSEDIVALEHGLPVLAPFLGHEYRGPKGIREYFEAISFVLKYENMRFTNFVVDPTASQVSVRGTARFTWKSTEQSWDEVFTYVLAFDNEQKVTKYEIWADTGAAYLASKGQLK